MVKTVVVPDVHVPFEHKAHVRRMLKYIKEEKPKKIVMLGDVLDFHALTYHRKQKDWRDRLLEEVSAGRKFLHSIRRSAGNKAEIIFIEGNHEDRWNRYVEQRAPHLVDLQHSHWSSHLALEQFGIELASGAVRTKAGAGQTVRFLHGHEVKGSSRIAGNHALNCARKLGENVHCGHTHRLGVLCATVGGKTLFGVEGGWLGDWTSPATKYIGIARPDWRVAFAVYDSENKTSPFPKMIMAPND